MLSETRRNSTEIYEIGTCRKSRTWAPCFRARIFSIRKYQTGTRRKIVIFHTCFTTPRLLIRISAIGQLTAQLHIPPCLTARLNLFQSIRALKIQRLRRMCLCARRSMQAGSLRVRLPRRLLRLILHRIHQVRLRQTQLRGCPHQGSMMGLARATGEVLASLGFRACDRYRRAPSRRRAW